MSLGLYTDVHVRIEITEGLRARGIDVLRAQEDGAERFLDPRLLDRATELGRVLFTYDDDFTREAAARQASGKSFGGVIYAHQLNVTIGECINDLELIAMVYDPQDVQNRLIYLPI